MKQGTRCLTTPFARLSALLVANALFMSLPLSAGTVTWQAVDGNWNGDWSQTAHWSSGALPTASDTVVFPKGSGNVTVTVNDTYAVGSVDVEAATGDAGRLTLTGSGQISLAGNSSFSTWVRANRALTLDGVSMIDTGTQDLVVVGLVTVRNGALLRNKRIAKYYYRDSELVVDGGRFEFVDLKYNGDEGPAGDNPMRLTLKSGTVSGTRVTGKDLYPFVIEISGGAMVVSSNFELHNTGSGLEMTGGSLRLNTAANIAPDAALNLTGGTLTLENLTDDARITGVRGLALKYDFGTGVFARSGSSPVSADSIRLLRFAHDSDASSVLRGKFREIVFSGNSEPFRIGTSSQRNFYLEGPTTIRAEANQTDTGGTTWYTHLTGDFTVDTVDAADGVTKRHLSLWSSSSCLGMASLTVRGGGSLCLLQTDSASTFRFINVEEGTTLNITNRTNGYQWGPVTAERFTLGANAKVTLPAKYNHIVADSFAIDPSATIEVTIGDALTCGAFAILQSPNGTTPASSVMSQIELKGSTSGWALKAENGQITLYKAGTLSGYATEWTGNGTDNYVTTLANFVSAIPTSSTKIYFGAGNTQTTAEMPAGNNQIKGLCFLETAISTFGYTSHGENAANNNSDPFFSSYSGVPQKHLGGRFRTYKFQAQTMGHGPLVFEGTSSDWNWGSGDYADGYWLWRNDGDARIARQSFNMRNVEFDKLDGADCYASYSRLTVLGGSTVEIQDLNANLAERATGFRVEEGGVLRFTDSSSIAKHGGDRTYKWTSSPAGTVVNGTMDVQIPFCGGADQAYGGRGTLKIASTVPSTGASRLWLMDTLTTELSNDWQTVTAGADHPFALGAAAGSPVLRVPDGWEYGAGAATSSSAEDRAIRIREGAVLTLDAGGGAARVGEAVVGDGTLAVAAGTALTLSSTNSAGLVVRGGARLNVPANLSLGSLTTENGAVLNLAQNAVLTVAGDVSLTNGVFAFDGEAPGGWRTVLVCTDGTVTGVPSDGGFLRTRLTTDGSGHQVVQCKAVCGILLIVR